MNRQAFTANLQGPWTELRDGSMRAPAVILVEGVHCGSSGCLYYPAHVLEKSADQWNGVPVTLNHPQVGQRPVSIKHSGAVESKFIIGNLTDARYEDKKLRATVNIHAEAARRLGHQLRKIKEVSTGLFSEDTEILGQHNALEFTACAIQIRPDHLALLTEQKGACSWADGCGLRANSGNSGNSLDPDPLIISKI